MYCPQCGGANEDAAGFCSSCGLDLNKYRDEWKAAQTREPAYEAPRYRPTVAPGSIPRIPSYLGWAIVVLICCFWPTGIAAVVYASQVDNKLVYGDIAGAREASRKAKMWCWISFGIGIGLALLGIIAAVVAIAITGSVHTYTY